MFRFVRAVALALAAALPLAAAAAGYPDRPVKLVVPYPPGGSTDVLGRALAELMRKELGQTVIVENKPGANTGIAAQSVGSAPPDGYTVLLATAATVVLNPLLSSKLAYDPAQLAPVARVAVTPLVLVTRSDSTFGTLGDALGFAKTNPGKLNYASTGVGSSLHLAGELLQHDTGAQMVHVPYKGSAPALTGLLGGETQLFFDAPASSLALIKGEKLKALAVTSATRLPVLPQVPTVAESGHPGFDVTTWFGLMVPRDTPDDVVAKLHAAATVATRDKGFREQFEALGMIVPEPMRPAEFRAHIAAESGKWAPLIRAKNITLD